jgi:hypothetical protein
MFFSQRNMFSILSTVVNQRKDEIMKTRSINYWISQIISAEENKLQKNTKQPNNTQDLFNYQIAEYLVNRKNTKSKVA